ncbi:cholesterol 25-hydroxylase-like protein [Neosynchiropus ocellatus]
MSVAFALSLGQSEPVLQGLWRVVRLGHEEVLLSPYLPATCALLTHLFFCLPFFLLDSLAGRCPRVLSWRIAASSGPPPPLRQWLRCFWRVVFKYAAAVFPATALFQSLRSGALPELAPSCCRLCLEVLACLLIFDFLFFVWHFCLHKVPWLYRNVHQQHHLHKVNFALAAQDASCAELLSLLLLALSSAWVVGCHPLSETVFHVLNSWLAVEDHCGYDFPWGLHRLLPGLGGAPYHQAHHVLHRANYAPYFTHWDHIFGTYRKAVGRLRSK